MTELVPAALNGLSDALLSLAALVVGLAALRGWRREHRADRRTGEEARIAAEDAKTYYAWAAVQRPMVIGAVLAGSVLKLIVLAWAVALFLGR